MGDGPETRGNRPDRKRYAQGVLLLFGYFLSIAALGAGLHLALYLAGATSRLLNVGKGWPLIVVIMAGVGSFIAVGAILNRIIQKPTKSDDCSHSASIAGIRLSAQLRKETKQHAKTRQILAKQRDASRTLRSGEITRLSEAWMIRAQLFSQMSPREFEDAVAQLFRKLGYEVEQTPYSNDGGKDAILWKDNKKFVIECKRYSKGQLTGRRDLQILVAAKHDVQADGALFISTGRFARTAIEYARENHITLYDGDHLPILVNQAFAEDSTMPHARVMCDLCGEIVEFDIFSNAPAIKN